MINWAEEWKEKVKEKTEERLSNKICPKCAENFVYSPSKLDEITTFPARGNGYIELLGCKVCKNVYYYIRGN